MTFREDIISMDGFVCRNPECLSANGDLVNSRWLSVHHIKYRSHGGTDAPENTITLCRLCDHAVHNGIGKDDEHVCGRVFMLRVLNARESLPDDRWHDAREELRKRYGEAA